MRKLFVFLLFLGCTSSFSNPVLHWRFANPVVVQMGDDCVLNFDVELSATEPCTFHIDLMSYIEYNTLAFGEDIALNGKLTYTRGNLIDLTAFGGYVYGVIGPNDGNECFNFFTELSVNLGLYEEMPMYPNFGCLFHISMVVEDPSELAGIKFKPNTGPPDFMNLMDGNQYYIDATHPVATPYGTPPAYEGIYENDLLNQNLVCSSSFTLDIKTYLDGPFNEMDMNNHLNQLGLLPIQQPFSLSPWNYNGTESVTYIPNSNITDWILVELRDAVDAASATSATVVARKACFILNDGQIVDLDGISLPEFQSTILNHLFVVLWHRNHLGIMTAVPVDLSGGSGIYDFTGSGSAAFGGTTAQKQLAPGIWGMCAGDGNADGNVMNGDKILVWRNSAGMFGYIPGDFNLDGYVNNQDKINCWCPNGGRSCQVPQ